MSKLYKLFQTAGNEVFSQEVSKIAPYFSTIEPFFKELRPGHAEVTVKNRKEIHNHLGTVHAIAMCNGAEAAAGLMTEASIPAGFRWIPIGMSVKYLAKATTDITVIADGSNINWGEAGDKDIPVSIRDQAGTDVCSATITVKISEIK
ncbi:hotdog fold domain-containing protein [Desulfopila sp. IMCC35008]|uniref:hotdog fold domain-containing protein n=1 Tax=Desulfopila sp. IMCC35008 TaxID=2653858 RepID=UPI0013D524C1|nr:hotdog fold domain-containing protein [Desulfopila sp. IMCC35008]